MGKKMARGRWLTSPLGIKRLLSVASLAVLPVLLMVVSQPVKAAPLGTPGADRASLSTLQTSSGSQPVPPQQGVVHPGQSAFTLLRQAGVSAAEVLTLQHRVRSVYNIRHLRVGQRYRIEVTADGHLRRFMYEIDARKRLEVERRGQTLIARLARIVYDRRQRLIWGSIHGSLYTTLAGLGESPKIAADLADIFAWNIDFHTDLRKGDTFRVLIEERYRDGELVGYHRILAAQLVNRRRVFQAVYYPPEGDKGAYYHPDGRSMRRMFLRSPLRYTRITSRFSQHRFHPILKRYRPHLGIDYAAPVGTPVRSVADGMVIQARRKGSSGKMIAIRHTHVYTTYYSHLARFARGIRVGKRVTQGQVIGYVGATGLATGPHLDFRITKYGKYLNPLLHKNIEAPSLSRRVLPAFRAYAARVLAKLAAPTLPQQHVTSPQPGRRGGEHSGRKDT